MEPVKNNIKMPATTKPEFVTVEILKKVLNDTLEEKLEEKLKFAKEAVQDTKVLKKQIAKLESKVKSLENYSRRNNIVIHGIPYSNEENVMEVAQKAGKLVGVSLEPRDIDIAHRLRSKNEKLPPPFIIKLVNRYKKFEIMAQARKLKPTAEKIGGEKKTKVFFNDHLTPEAQHILTAAKEISNQVKVWSRNGEVFCQGKEPGCRILKLESLDDVQRIVESYKDNNEDNYEAGRMGQKRTVWERSPNNETIRSQKKTITTEDRQRQQRLN